MTNVVHCQRCDLEWRPGSGWTDCPGCTAQAGFAAISELKAHGEPPAVSPPEHLRDHIVSLRDVLVADASDQRYSSHAIASRLSAILKAAPPVVSKPEKLINTKGDVADGSIGDLLAYGREESTNALKAKDRDSYQFWQGWNSALERAAPLVVSVSQLQELVTWLSEQVQTHQHSERRQAFREVLARLADVPETMEVHEAVARVHRLAEHYDDSQIPAEKLEESLRDLIRAVSPLPVSPPPPIDAQLACATGRHSFWTTHDGEVRCRWCRKLWPEVVSPPPTQEQDVPSVTNDLAYECGCTVSHVDGHALSFCLPHAEEVLRPLSSPQAPQAPSSAPSSTATATSQTGFTDRVVPSGEDSGHFSPQPTQEHEHEGELCWTPRQMDAIAELLNAERERAALSSPQAPLEDFCSTCGDLISRHFTPCNLAPDADSVLRLLVTLVNEGKKPAALRVLARHMHPHEDDGARLIQSASSPQAPQELLKKAIKSALCDLAIAKDFLQEAGTDPEVWLDAGIETLRRAFIDASALSPQPPSSEALEFQRARADKWLAVAEKRFIEIDTLKDRIEVLESGSPQPPSEERP